MSGNPDDERLEELREERMQELKDKQSEGGNPEAAEQARAQQDAQKKAALRKHLTDGARQRLNSVKMSKPQFGEQAEQQILRLAQSGRVQGKIDEDQMKELLQELKPDSQSYNVTRR